jgi:hypothetical protein
MCLTNARALRDGLRRTVRVRTAAGTSSSGRLWTMPGSPPPSPRSPPSSLPRRSRRGRKLGRSRPARFWACPVRAHPGRLGALGISYYKSVLYGTFVWARGALNSAKRRFPARPAPHAVPFAAMLDHPAVVKRLQWIMGPGWVVEGPPGPTTASVGAAPLVIHSGGAPTTPISLVRVRHGRTHCEVRTGGPAAAHQHACDCGMPQPVSADSRFG